MHKDNHQSPAAIAYAKAMLDLANDSKSAASVGQELRDLRQIIDTNLTFAQILADPSISVGEREKLLRSIFSGKASPLVLNFLLLLNKKGRLKMLAAIGGAYDDLLDEQQGLAEVDITVAQSLNAKQLESVRQKISDSLKREAVVHQYVDPSIIGGLVLRVQDQLIDGSVRAQLAAMRQRLLAARPN